MQKFYNPHFKDKDSYTEKLNTFDKEIGATICDINLRLSGCELIPQLCYTVSLRRQKSEKQRMQIFTQQ